MFLTEDEVTRTEPHCRLGSICEDRRSYTVILRTYKERETLLKSAREAWASSPVSPPHPAACLGFQASSQLLLLAFPCSGSRVQPQPFLPTFPPPGVSSLGLGCADPQGDRQGLGSGSERSGSVPPSVPSQSFLHLLSLKRSQSYHPLALKLKHLNACAWCVLSA